MLVTDLDGTLLDPHGRLRPQERHTLEALGEQGVVRAVATGRNLHSARRVMQADFPVDYLVFASGAGIMDWQGQRLLAGFGMQADDVARALACLRALQLDFMLHHAVPENHRFHWFSHGRENPDFVRRWERYREFALPWEEGCEHAVDASQLLAIESHPADAAFAHGRVAERLGGLNVVRTTSPLDHRSTWIEIFPAGVSKSAGAAWLAERHALAAGDVIAVGNDWNDCDLLEWAGQSFVVGNAVPELLERHATVAANDAGGVSEAVRCWFAATGSSSP